MNVNVNMKWCHSRQSSFLHRIGLSDITTTQSWQCLGGSDPGFAKLLGDCKHQNGHVFRLINAILSEDIWPLTGLAVFNLCHAYLTPADILVFLLTNHCQTGLVFSLYSHYSKSGFCEDILPLEQAVLKYTMTLSTNLASLLANPNFMWQ